MYLIHNIGNPNKVMQDKETRKQIKAILKENQLSIYSSVYDIRNILVKEILKEAGQLNNE